VKEIKKNLPLRLPISLRSLPLRYGQEKEEGLDQDFMISKLQEMKRSSEISEEDFHRYLKRLIKKEQSRTPVKNKGFSAGTKSTAADPKRLT
jgi:hypothetical protein